MFFSDLFLCYLDLINSKKVHPALNCDIPKGVKFLKHQLLKRGDKTLLIVDESTTIKNKRAKRTQELCKIGYLAKYRRILTGSPVTKNPLDL